MISDVIEVTSVVENAFVTVLDNNVPFGVTAGDLYANPALGIALGIAISNGSVNAVVPSTFPAGRPLLFTETVGLALINAVPNLVPVHNGNEPALAPAGTTVLSIEDGVPRRFDGAEWKSLYKAFWGAQGKMQVRRFLHTVTPLLDGRVLVTGGTDPSFSSVKASHSCELWDNATNKWAITAPLPDGPRSFHGAVRLADGKVLVFGGCRGTNLFSDLCDATDGATHISECFVFDPVAETWAQVGNLPAGFTYVIDGKATGILLNDGRVMVCGGIGSTSTGICLDIPVPPSIAPQAKTAIFDPVAGTWAAGGDMTIPRFHHTISLLPSGDVLAVGGTTADDSAPLDIPGNTDTCEIFTPGADTWAATDSLPDIPAEYLAGGAGLRSIDGTSAFKTTRSAHLAETLADGRVLVAGGFGPSLDPPVPGFGSNFCARWSSVVYDEAALPGAKWTVVGNMPVPKAFGVMARVETDKVIACLGSDEENCSSAAVAVFTPGPDTWEIGPDFPSVGSLTAFGRPNPFIQGEAHEFGAVLADGRLFICGGAVPMPSLGNVSLFFPFAQEFRSHEASIIYRDGHLEAGTPIVNPLTYADPDGPDRMG